MHFGGGMNPVTLGCSEPEAIVSQADSNRASEESPWGLLRDATSVYFCSEVQGFGSGNPVVEYRLLDSTNVHRKGLLIVLPPTGLQRFSREAMQTDSAGAVQAESYSAWRGCLTVAVDAHLAVDVPSKVRAVPRGPG